LCGTKECIQCDMYGIVWYKGVYTVWHVWHCVVQGSVYSVTCMAFCGTRECIQCDMYGIVWFVLKSDGIVRFVLKSDASWTFWRQILCDNVYLVFWYRLLDTWRHYRMPNMPIARTLVSNAKRLASKTLHKAKKISLFLHHALNEGGIWN
jgi:hypothetical protein